jgi:hypothetical protein
VIDMNVDLPSPSRRLPVTGVVLSAVTLLGSLVLQMLSLPLGVAALVIGVLAFRRTRGGPARDAGLGSLALGIVAAAVSLLWFTIGLLFLLGNAGG